MSARNMQTPLEKLKIILTSYLQETASNTPYQKKALGYLRNNDWPRLYQLADELSTEVYDSAYEHYIANQFGALLLKYPFDYKMIGLEKTPRRTAYEKFAAAEDRCRKTNRRFRSLGSRKTRFNSKIEEMRAFIIRVIGEEPPTEIFEGCAFGPGANIGVHGDATNLARKFFSEEGWTVTPSAIPTLVCAIKSNFSFVLQLCETHNGYACLDESHVEAQILSRLKIVSYNKLSFVPKTAKTDRCIAIEPLGNSFLQSGVEKFLKRCLRRIGIDLSNQQRNALKAKLGSITGKTATVDLRSASDTQALMLCKVLFPAAWFRLFDAIRSPAYLHPETGETTRYEKFTSMGNGFCFPLETLIFAAIIRSCTTQEEFSSCAVYGDDLIMPVTVYEDCVELLAFCGFETNSDKSFSHGPFRESCGADWYNGLDVRPVYLDYHLTDSTSLMIFHNATLRGELTTEAFQKIRPLVRSWCDEEERFMRPSLLAENPHTEDVDFSDLLAVKNLNGAFTVPIDVFMSSRWAHWVRDQSRWSWKEYYYTPCRDKCAERSYPVAQYWNFLLGSLGGELHYRRKTKRRVHVI